MKNILAVILSTIILTLFVVMMNADAVYEDENSYKNIFNYNLRELDSEYNVLYSEEYERAFVAPGVLMLEEINYTEIVFLNLSDDATKEKADKCLREIVGNYGGLSEIETDNNYEYYILVKPNELKNVMKAMKERNLISNAQVKILERLVDQHFLPYYPSTYKYEDLTFEILSKYVSEIGLEANIEIVEWNGKAIQIIPQTSDYFDSCLEIALGIYNRFGFKPKTYDVDTFITTKETIEPIELFNYIDGDANCDGKYTIADSTAILQHLGNEDKYGLSLQGEFNADIYNVGDGVTPMDALEVQKVMASKG